MRGIERIVAGALLVLAVTGTAVFARTSAPGGRHAQAVRLQSPPRSHLVAPLPVVVALPEAPPRRVVARPAKPPVPVLQTTVALATPVEVPPAAPPPPAAAAAPSPAPPAAPTPAPAPAPTASPTAPTRVIAVTEQPQPTTTKTYGHSHPRGHAWGHVKHATAMPSVDGSETRDGAQSQSPAAPAPAPPADTPPVAQDQPSPDQSSGNGHGNAWGHSKHANGN